MCGDADDAGAREGGEVSVLKLLADGPRDEVSRLPVPSAQLREHGFLGDLALEAHLQHAWAL